MLKRLILLILLLVINVSALYAHQGHFEDNGLGLEEPEEYKKATQLPQFLEEEKPSYLPKPIGGYGTFHLVVVSVRAFNINVISQKGYRAELWLDNSLLAELDTNDVKVDNERNIRFFDFPYLSMKTGYYFIKLRLYSKGVLWKNEKFHEEIFQVGIHEGKTTSIYKKVPFLNW